MKALVCEMCGSHGLVKQDGMYVCQHCGIQYSVEEAKKMMIEGAVDVSGSTVKIDSTNELENLYESARRTLNDRNYKQAKEYFAQILAKDPTSWEAYFYSFYCSAWSTTVANIPNVSSQLARCIGTTLDLIRQSDDTDVQKVSNLLKVKGACASIVPTLYAGIWKSYDKNGYYNNPRYFAQQALPVFAILANLAARVKQFNQDGHYSEVCKLVDKDFDKYIYADVLKMEVSLYKTQIANTRDANEIERCNKLVEEIQQFDASYVGPTFSTANKSGCYVATAVYGSYDCPQVWTLRRFRDNTLAETWYGRVFIHTYYAISPTLVKWFGKAEWFRKMWRPTLDKMVKRLNDEGVKDKPYNDRIW